MIDLLQLGADEEEIGGELDARDQLRVALRLDMRTPFGRLHGKNPEIISLAKKIGRH